MANVSTFGAFTSARLGMYAAMKGLSVTGQNISNINTKGYTRQILNQKSLNLSGGDRYSSIYDTNVGSGVLCTGVSQLRDPYLDIRYRNEQSSVGAMDSKLSALEDLSAVLDEVGKGDGNGVLEKTFNELMTQLNNLTKNPNNQANDGLVRAAATTLTTLLNNYSKKLDGAARDQLDGYDQDVKNVNSILENIRDLNSSIQKSEIHGDAALELRDQRNMLLDELSTYMKVDITYTTTQVAPNTFVQNLVITLDDGNKTPLVDGAYAGKLSLDKTGRPDLSLEVSPLENRKGNIHPIHDTAQLLGSDLLGGLASTREMLTAAGEFTIDPATGAPAPSTKRGIPYYQKTLDGLANKLATAMNEANQPYQVDGEGYYLDSAGAPIANGSGGFLNKNNPLTPAEEALKVAHGVRLGGVLFSNSNTGNATDSITAGNISISADWTSGATKIQVSDKAGSLDGTNIAHIIYVLMDSEQTFKPNDVVGGASNTTYFTGSFQKMFSNICSTLATDKMTTTTMLENYATTANTLNFSRDSVAGVDLNDEAANMMQYQKSYSAAARLMTTIDEALDKLINGTGTVGR